MPAMNPNTFGQLASFGSQRNYKGVPLMVPSEQVKGLRCGNLDGKEE